MAKKIIRMELTSNSINDAINYLTNYQIELERKAGIIARRLSEKGVDIAKVILTDLDAVFTNELIDSIHSEDRGGVNGGAIFCVCAGTDHCAFVEFGTGMVGKQSPYPYQLPAGVSWNYATGKTIRQLADGRYGWFYPGDDGKWYFTEGMPARPYMYETSLRLQKMAIRIVKEVMNG